MQFQWDDKKAESNKKKHDVSFEEATSVFGDVYARVIDDEAHSDFEDRFIILGYSLQARLLVVCHCYREENEVIRIISARKATKTEEQTYWRFFHEETV